MSNAIRLFHGPFGRVALLEMDAPLVSHAHHHCHLLIKAGGPDTAFRVRGENCPLTDDNAVMINAWEEHAYTHEVQTPDLPVILALYLEPAWLAMHSRQLTGSAHPRFFAKPVMRLSADQRRRADKVTMELWWADEIVHDQLEAMLLDLVLSFIEGADEVNRGGTISVLGGLSYMDPRIRRALAEMRCNPAELDDIGAIAARVKLSRSHFFAMFKRCTGLSPVVYANVLRMERAFEALASSDASLGDIGMDLGFSAQSHFTRFFRQHQGVLPSAYRRQVEITDPGQS